MTSPFVTLELKSTLIAWMRPDTCVLTMTVTSGERVPLAVTLATIRCFPTGALRYVTSGCAWVAT